MNWFKHYANADKDSRLQRLKTDYGFWGMGVYWGILERVVCYGEGCYPRNELMGMKLNRRDTGVIKAVLDRYDLFLTDEFGMVRCIKSVQQSDTFVSENDKNVHECDTEVTTLCTDSEVKNGQEVSDNEENISESIAHTYVEEKREEKKGEEKNNLSLTLPEGEGIAHSNSPRGGGLNTVEVSISSPSGRVEGAIIHELRTNRSWQEAVCMTSGYGALLMRHFDRAVDIFLRHVQAGADEVELTDRRRAMNYFRNFTRLSHPAGRALKEELERLSLTALRRENSPIAVPARNRPEREGTENVSSMSFPPLGGLRRAFLFEDPPGPNGERSYHGGRLLPPDAPPRPSPQAEWDEAEEKWLIMN